MENKEIKTDATFNTAIYQLKNYEINWDKITTIDDVKAILKGLQINVNVSNNNIPKNCRELFDKNLLIEKK